MEQHHPRPGEFYRHFKGKLYQILTVAVHSETDERLVIYQALYGDYQTYARPLAMFLSPVDREKYPEATQEYRFQAVVPTQADTIGTCFPSDSTVPEVLPETMPEVPLEAVPEVPLSEASPEVLFLHFLDANTYQEQLTCLSLLRGKLSRTMLDSIAASIDLILPGNSLEDDLDLVEAHIRTKARFEGRRMR